MITIEEEINMDQRKYNNLPFKTGEDFIHGDEAVARGAILAGCKFYGGYPITPASEIMESLSAYLPKVGGDSVQMEDELGSIAAAIGASWGGKRSMTATSGPGFSLMQENLGYAIMTETPMVLANVQRGGPSTGQPTLPAQGDVMQAKWGTHGDHPIIVLSPSSVQETIEMTINSFNLSENYRIPVILLLDAELGHMRENVKIPSSVELVERSEEMPVFGEGSRKHVTGLVSDENGFPETSDVELGRKNIENLNNKIKENRDQIIDYEEYKVDDADTILISYGTSARSAKHAVNAGRSNDMKIGAFILKTIFPFPYERLKKIDAEQFIAVEMNMGQIYHSVREGNPDKTEKFTSVGGVVPDPRKILNQVKEEK